MATKYSRRRRRTRRPDVLHKPRGVISPRVQKVGPERFGIVSVDCAKARSKWLLADFYGEVIVPPTIVEHSHPALEGAVSKVREALAGRGIQDVLVAVERTGRYHRPVQRAFASAGFDTRVVHPFTAKQFRLPADPGVKTDDKDLAAIHRAAVNGFALKEAGCDGFWRELQLLIRHRRDTVQKASTLCCQIREHLEAALPGYAANFPKLWGHAAALELALQLGSASEILRAGIEGMASRLRQAGVRFQRRTLQRVLRWAGSAAAADEAADWHRRIAGSLNEDRMRKRLQVQGLDRQIAAVLAQTPYVLLLSIPGINVVSAGDFAGEAGPMANYPTSRCITGRAGLYPSRYQSDLVDHPDGPMVKCANRRLRHAILQAADCLITCNHHFMHLASHWRNTGGDSRLIRVRVGLRFCRIAFQMVAGGKVFRHPCMRDRHYILQKLIAFHCEHQTPVAQTLADLRAATKQIPASEHAEEARPLQQQMQSIRPSRRGPQPLREILPAILAELGVGRIEYSQLGQNDPT